VEALNCHAAEIDKQEKNRISHRGKAIRELLTKLAGNLSDTLSDTLLESAAANTQPT
jgi:XTP/dITP diphosphohydrolase